MRKSRFIFLAAVLLCGGPVVVSAQNGPRLGNRNEGMFREGVPRGWSAGGNTELRYGTLWGGVPDGKRAAFLMASKKMTQRDFGTLMQTISADAYRGRRVRLSAMVSVEQSLDSGRVALWMRVNDESGNVAAFDDMAARPILVTPGWKRQEIVLDVPGRAASITFGVLLSGGDGQYCCFGRAAISDFRLETVDSDVPLTAVPGATLPDAPVNADFSER